MNNQQRCVILCGFVVILFLGLIPPRLVHDPRQPTGCERSVVNSIFETHTIGFQRTVFSPRTFPGGNVWRVNASLLLVQWFLVSTVTGIIVMYLGDRRKSPANKPDE